LYEPIIRFNQAFLTMASDGSSTDRNGFRCRISRAMMRRRQLPAEQVIWWRLA
jgi:hypothetical protein